MVERLAAALGCTMFELFDFSEQRGDDESVARLKDQMQVLIKESDSRTLDLTSLIVADLIHHGRKVRSERASS